MIGKVHFGTTIHAVMRENGLSMADVGKASGTIESQFSKWKAGRWQVIPEKRLLAVLAVACKTPEQREACILAYAVDMIPAGDRSTITFGSKRAIEKATASVNADLQLKFTRIAKAIPKDGEFRKMFDTLAGWAKVISEK